MIWNKLGASYANSHQSDAAIESYHRALEINPSYIRALYNLSISSLHEQRYKEAANYLLNALNIYEQDAESIQVGRLKGLDSETLWNALTRVVEGFCKFEEFHRL